MRGARRQPESGRAPAPPIVAKALGAPGRPLPPGVRGFMAGRFGRDFSQVRVHTDETAAESARAVDALAYTVGQDVVFAAGRYAPATAAGQRLLAHELAHTVQQGRGAGAREELAVSSPGDPLERQAEQGAAAALAGGPASVPALGLTSGPAHLARQQPAPPASPPTTGASSPLGFLALTECRGAVGDDLAMLFAPLGHTGLGLGTTAAQLRTRIASDYLIVGGSTQQLQAFTGRTAAQLGATVPAAPAAGTDRPFQGGALATATTSAGIPSPASFRRPELGFLSIPREVVEALTEVGLAWGAVDIPGEPGDVQHFDCRLLPGGCP